MGGGRGKGYSIRTASPLRQQLKEQEHRRLTDYLDEGGLEQIIHKSRKSIIKHREAHARAALKYLYPEAYSGLLLAEFLYKHKEVIYKTIEDIDEIWSDDSSISEKIVETGATIIKSGAEITKKELKEKVIDYISSKFAEAATDKIDRNKIIEKVSGEVGLEDHADRFKDLLKNTIQEQTADTIESIFGG